MFNDLNFLFQYLKKEKIYIDQNEFEFQIQSHPNYPSLLSISDTLNFFKINNIVTKIDNNDLKCLPKYFVGQIINSMDTLSFYLVENKINSFKYFENNKIVEKTEEIFLKSFKNVILLVEKEDNEQSKAKTQNLFFFFVSGLFGFIYLFLIFINDFSNVTCSVVCLASIGVYLSYQAILGEFGIKTKFSEAVCNISINSDCNAVQHTVKSKVIAKIGYNNVAISFFCCQIITLLFFSISKQSDQFFEINAILLLCSLPVILFSFYHQGFVAKKWCPICTAIILIILFQSSILAFGFNLKFYIDLFYFAIYVFILSGIYSIIYTAKNIYKININLKSLITENNRFKRNYSLFRLALFNSERLTNTELESEKIILGNPNAVLKIIVVTSPFCSHCKKSIKLINDILERYNDKVCIQIHFNVDYKSANQNSKLLHLKFLEIYFEDGEHQLLKNLYNWFETNTIDQNKVVNKYSLNEIRYINIIQNQYEWNVSNGLNFTPAIVINDLHYPKEYSNNDFIYFIDELLDDESFNL